MNDIYKQHWDSLVARHKVEINEFWDEFWDDYWQKYFEANIPSQDVSEMELSTSGKVLGYPGFPSKVPPRIMEIIHGDALSVVDGKSPYEWKLVDHSKPHPMMKYQYTYLDIKQAYEAGIDSEAYKDEYLMNGSPIPNFEDWFKDDFKPEIDEHNDSE